MRRFGANRLGGANTRGRQPRLAVIDAATVDGRRRLVLIRRDNVEHLLMIGGPSDLVVEPNIVRATAARETGRETQRAETALRAPAAADSTFPLQPVSEPAPPSRPYRASATEEPWLPPEPGARPRPADSGSLTGLASELSTRLNPPEQPSAPVVRQEQTRHEPPVRQELRQEPRHEPRQSAPPQPEPEPQAADHNLAEMAQQLEAALRRTPVPEGRPPVTDPLAMPASPRPPARDYKLRVDPQFETRAEPRFDARPEAKPEPRPEMKPAPKFDSRPKPAAPGGKAVYDSLEEEMASLLGRPPGKT